MNGGELMELPKEQTNEEKIKDAYAEINNYYLNESGPSAKPKVLIYIV